MSQTTQHPFNATFNKALNGTTARVSPVSNENSPVVPQENGKISGIPLAPVETSNRRLILTLDGKILSEIPVTDKKIVIGRKHTNDIQLNDLTLSGHHAQISSVPDYVFIEDLGSTNGTLVNGNHVKKVALEHGDIIQLGRHQLTYLHETQNSYEPTMFVKAEFDETQFIHTNENRKLAIKGLPLGGFRTISGPAAKSIMELRKTYNSIGFQGKRVALITRATSGYFITSVASTRSRRASDIPRLNGNPINTELTLLKENDIINIAGFEVQFYFLR
ncbi:MAG: FHA domain-containing protein [Ectothiorhodospiraceae bacterium]|nr:FHA domain-containing protein [Ectothiorhodospiraceae bacterium]